MKLLSSKLAQIFSNKWAVSSSGSTVHVVRAAEPVLLWAASSWAHSSFTLLLGSHLDKLLLHANKWAAEPVLFWAATSWAHGSITLLLGSHLDELLLHANKWAVSGGGSAVHVVRAAEPVLFWAATSWAHGSITLLLGSHLAH